VLARPQRLVPERLGDGAELEKVPGFTHTMLSPIFTGGPPITHLLLR
jgi:hypothetical protein